MTTVRVRYVLDALGNNAHTIPDHKDAGRRRYAPAGVDHDAIPTRQHGLHRVAMNRADVKILRPARNSWRITSSGNSRRRAAPRCLWPADEPQHADRDSGRLRLHRG